MPYIFATIQLQYLERYRTATCSGLVFLCIFGSCSIRVTKRIWPSAWQTNKMACAAKTQSSLVIRPVWSEFLLCTHLVTKDPSSLHAYSEDSNQTGRSLRLAHMPFCWFCHTPLRKHAYSNILKSLPPKKKWKFTDKKLWWYSYFCSKHRLWVLVRTALTRRL